MRELKTSTKAGQNIIARANHFEGRNLSDVYNTWSREKESAYNNCISCYLDTENHQDFRICSHNTFGFTCSWFGEIDGERILRYETKDNSYIVYLER